MKRDLFTIGEFTLHGYGLMIAIGILSAYLCTEYRAKKRNMEYEKIFDMTIWCAVIGLIGAKLLYCITILPEIIENPAVLLEIGDGFVVYGGIIAGILAGYLFCKKNHWNFLEYFDLAMPAIALAQGFGRIGCFLAGCCYGKECSASFGIVFPNGSSAPAGVPLIPTQLISSGLDFLNFLVLILIARKQKAPGVIAGCYLIFYSAGRFVIEFFRGDLIRGFVGVLSTSQFIAIILFVVGLIIVRVSQKCYKKKCLEDGK